MGKGDAGGEGGAIGSDVCSGGDEGGSGGDGAIVSGSWAPRVSEQHPEQAHPTAAVLAQVNLS